MIKVNFKQLKGVPVLLCGKLARMIGKKHKTSAIHQFSVTNIEGDSVELSKYKGKVLLIVNTASECTFTPQFKELEELYSLYRDKGFEILAFPSNDFGKQEPLEGKKLEEFCRFTFRTTFPVFEKIHVKGRNADPLFKFLSNRSENGKVNISPKWNFQKYLVNQKGEVCDFFLPFTKPTAPAVKQAIEKLLV
jgi:glutathione peroxidase